jgi:REP element-mobilizing transposase RayT
MNRGLAHRTVFERREDMRMFLSLLAREVRAARIEVHAYCLMSTHFHLLVRSPSGQLSEGLRRVENGYVRYFNRTRFRDGSLFRGRFLSIRTESEEHWIAVVSYIDRNAVEAKLARVPEEYPYGSARAYAGLERHIWLSMGEVQATARAAAGVAQCTPAAYAAVYGANFSQAKREPAAGTLDLGASIDVHQVQPWMHECARLADGTRLGWRGEDPEAALGLLDRARAAAPEWTIRAPRARVDGWDLVRAAMLRGWCEMTIREIAVRCRLTPAAVWRRLQRHDELLRTDPAYAARNRELEAACAAALSPGETTVSDTVVSPQRARRTGASASSRPGAARRGCEMSRNTSASSTRAEAPG